MEKSPEAFRTISEVAEDLDVPQHVLRFWEGKFSQVKPMKRAGGRRYYRPNDLELLRGIRHLLYGEGYTIKGVQRILREQGTGYVIEAGKQKALPQQGGGDEASEAAAPEAASQQAAPRVPPPAAPQEILPPTKLEGSDLQVLSGVLKELNAIKTMLTGGKPG